MPAASRDRQRVLHGGDRSGIDEKPDSDRGVDEIAIGRPSRWFIRSYIAPSPRTRRTTAPKMITPAPAIDEDVLDRFLLSNERIRVLVRRAGDYDVNRIRFRNPFVPVIRFTIGTGFEILSRHEDRHLLQAERVRQASGFPAA